jgi:YidC/Oxa1 family membrane protein insertase
MLSLQQQLPFTPPESRAMMKTLAYVITPVSLIVTIYLPAGVQWFFLVSAILQYGQSWLWRQPWLRKWARLGPIPFSPTQSGRVVQGANGGMKWQAAQPRSAGGGGGGAGTVIPTTARSLAEAEGDLSVRGIAQGLRDGWGSVKEKRDAYVKKTTAKADKSRQKDYEEKRALEDDNGFYERRNRKRRSQ